VKNADRIACKLGSTEKLPTMKHDRELLNAIDGD